MAPTIVILIMLLIWNLAPLIAIGVAYFAIKKWRTKGTVARTDAFAGFLLSVILTAGFILFTLHSMLMGADPQSALGLLFAPILSWLVALSTFGIGWSTSVLIRYAWIQFHATEKSSRVSSKSVISASVFLGLSMAGGSFLYRRLIPYSKAESTTVSADELRTLYLRASRVDNYQMLMRLAQNPKCPSNILRQLGQSPNLAIVSRVARNPNLTGELFEELASNHDMRIRAWLTDNPVVPRRVLEKLANDSDDLVKRGATYRLRGGVPSPSRKLGTFNNILDLLFG